MYDIVIIGGGPAGMTAALYALRANRSVLVLEKNNFGGQIAFSPKVENYPGSPCISGSELADRLLSQILDLGAEIEIGNAVSIEESANGKTVVAEDGAAFEGRSLIIAAGAKHRMLGLPGEESLIGNGISYCAVCDGDFCRGKKAAIVGGGNTALQEALLLSDLCSHVSVVQNLAQLTGEKRLAEALRARKNVEILLNSQVSGFEADNGVLRSILIQSQDSDTASKLSVDGLFIAIGLAPENSIFRSIADLDDCGYIDSDEQCTTRTPGVFVAGDCRTKKVRQLTTAVADGAVAAISACRFLSQMDQQA